MLVIFILFFINFIEEERILSVLKLTLELCAANVKETSLKEIKLKLFMQEAQEQDAKNVHL